MAIVTFDSDSVRTGSGDWRGLVKSAIRDPRTLCERLQLPLSLIDDVSTGHQLFSTFVPEPYLARIRPGDVNDPLLLQVLPGKSEAIDVPGFSADPVGDESARRAPGLIHKYHGRALLITRGVCAVHCRYCFRRHYPYETEPVSVRQFEPALKVVREDSSLEELILSGGDPLMMVDDQLAGLVQQIESIPHVRRLRIHSRLPIVIPQRTTPALLRMLDRSRLETVLVIHANHPQEIDEHVRDSVQQWARHGIVVLNQSVLLRNINDDLETLVELSRRLIGMNCIPYYLHQLDRVSGATHFEVPQQQGESLIRQMRIRLPGYAVPRYVHEVAGQSSKQWIV